jgi:hypothetical protein
LKHIKCPLLADADVAEALELAFKRLDSFRSRKPDRKAIVIVLTNGQLQNSEAKKTGQIATELRKRNCRLYLTGTSRTNKRILIAASQGHLSWCLISQANPSVWIEELRKSSEPDTSEQPATAPSSKDEGEEAAEQQESQETEGQETPKDKLSQDVASGQRTEGELKLQGHVDGTILIARSDQRPPDESIAQAQETLPLPEQLEPNTAELEEAEQAEEPVPTESGPEPEPEKGPTKWFWQFLLAPTVLLIGLAIFLVKAKRTAQQWKHQVNSHLAEDKPTNPGTLVAKLNGQVYQLGPLTQFRQMHVGSGPKNTIKIIDDSVEGRHVKIYRHNDDLILKNLAKSPVIANGMEIKTRQRCRLVVPARIELNENLRLNLELLHQDKSSGEQESKNGSERQQEILA